MDTVPTSVIECALLDGAPPQLGDGGAWCDAHNKCEGCAQDVVDAARDELRHLKAERDRALAELDKALGEREERGCIHYDPKRHYCEVHDCETDDYKRGYDEGFASADDWLGQHEDAMAEHGWIRLPKDADGEPIRIGDVLDETTVMTYAFLPANVVGYHECCGKVMPIVEHDGEFQVDPEFVCHYTKRTVEDVLREFIDKWLGTPHVSERELFAEYAAKLRLAGDAE